MSTRSRSRAWVEVDGSAILRNLATLRRRIGPEPGFLPMVKADAYGLGVEGVVKLLEPEEPAGYGVATVEEGCGLRELGVERPVLVFSPAPGGPLKAAIEMGLTLCLSDLSMLDELRALARGTGRRAEFHLEIDTGMGRSGHPWNRLEPWRERLEGLEGSELRWTGCFTHFHSADVAGSSGVPEQWSRFQESLEGLPTPRDPGFLVHACNSAAALRYPELAGDMVRPGIFMYGGVAGEELPDPAPVASLRARVIHTRDASPGDTVGYGATHTAGGPERWATLAVGYGDGLPWILGNRGQVLVRGSRAPMVGRISMDMTVVDMTGVPGVEAGDVATLIGTDGDQTISLEEVAELASTINYEILTGLTPRLPRVWIRHDGE